MANKALSYQLKQNPFSIVSPVTTKERSYAIQPNVPAR